MELSLIFTRTKKGVTLQIGHVLLIGIIHYSPASLVPFPADTNYGIKTYQHIL